MTLSRENQVAELNNPKRIASLQAALLLAVFLVMAISITYQARNLQTWVGLTLLILAYARVLFTLLGFYLIRNDRIRQGILVLVGLILVSLPALAVFVSGISWLMGLATLVITIFLVGGTLPSDQRNRIAILSLVVAIFTGLLDLVPLPFRLAPPIPLVSAWVFFIGLWMFALAYAVLRGYGRFNLRVKLTTAFLVIIISSVTVISYFASRTIEQNLVNQVGTDLNTIAASQATIIGDELSTQINILESFTLNNTVQDKLVIAEAIYPAGTDVSAELEAMEAQWQEADDLDPIVQSRLTGLLAFELQDFHEAFPQFRELMITDRHGALLAATGRPAHYSFAGTPWWRAVVEIRAGEAFIGQPTAADDDTLIMPMAVPVNLEGQLIGVLYASYDLTVLRELTAASRVGETGIAEIYLPNGLEIEFHGAEVELEEAEFDINLLSDSTASGVPFLEVAYDIDDETPSIVSSAPVAASTSEPAIAGLGWVIVIHQEAQEALAPVQNQQFLTNILTGGVAIVAMGIGIWLSRLLFNPVDYLTKTAAEVGAGDLSVRAVVETGDEMQTLAETFNQMTARLQQTVSNLEQRNRAVETSGEVSRTLASTLDPNELLRNAASQIQSAFDYYRVEIYVWDNAQEQLVLSTAAGTAATVGSDEGETRRDKNWIRRAWLQQKAVFIPEVNQDAETPFLPDTKTAAALPIMLGVRMMGVLAVQENSSDGLTPADVTLLQSIANQIAIALQNARRAQQVQESEARTRTVLESVTMPMLISRAGDGKLLYVNEYAAEVVGMTLEELRQKGTPDFYVDTADRSIVVQKIQEQGFVTNYELRVKRATGDIFWALLSARLITFDEEPAIITTLVDITDRKQLEASQARQAANLQTVAEINTLAMSVPDVQEMLPQVMNLIQEKLELYHAHVYLLNESQDTLILAAGAGDAGRQMVRERYQIHLAQMQSLVARAARTIQPILVNDVTAAADHLPNPLLPATRAELALPLVAGNRALGVLDVQADVPGYFSDAEVNIMATLANQLASSIQAAQSLERAERTAAQLNLITQRLTRTGWKQFTESTKGALAYAYDLQEIRPAPENEGAGDRALVQPLQVQGEEIGSLAISGPETLADDADEVAAEIAARLSSHLENLRLAQQTQMALTRTETLYQGSAEVVQARTMGAVLRALATSTELQQMERASIFLFDRPWDEKPTTLTLAANWTQPHLQPHVPTGTTFPIAQLPILSIFDPKRPFILQDVSTGQIDPDIQALFAEMGITSIVGFALMAGERWFGLVTGESSTPITAINDEEVRQIRSLVDQAATVIRNLQLIEETTSRARQEQLLREVTGRIYAAPDAESILRLAAQEVNRALGLESFIYLQADDLAAEAAEPANGHS